MTAQLTASFKELYSMFLDYKNHKVHHEYVLLEVIEKENQNRNERDLNGR